MSNPSASVLPGPRPRSRASGIVERARDTAGRLVRGDPAEPAWSRPALLGVLALACVLAFWGLTGNGTANDYYASAVYAGSRSWKAMFFDALDLSGYVSVDKTPLAIWLMSLSARVFGFSSFSMLLPDALCGVGAVLVLHNAVKRTLGHRAATVAALLLALTPASVLMARFNNPDAVLVFLLVCSAWALVRALESGRTRFLVLAGALVGLAFNAKMLQAYLVVPGLGLAYLIAGPARWPRRVGQLLAGLGTMLVVSFAWVVTMMALPASARPYVGDSTGNSWWNLIFSANGLDRVGSGGPGSGGAPFPGAIGRAGSGVAAGANPLLAAGGPGAPGAPGVPGGRGGGFGGAQGLLRMFNDQVGGQIAWLLPLALVGLLVGLWCRRRAGRTDPARAAYVLWGAWGAVHFYVFSFSLTLFHPYYANALAPAVAVLAAAGLVELWTRATRSTPAALMLAGSVGGTVALAVMLLARTPSFVPWTTSLVIALAALTALALLMRRALAGLPGRSPGWLTGRRVALIAVSSGLVAVAAGPASYAVATIGRPASGGNPLAGPAQADLFGFRTRGARAIAGGARAVAGGGMPFPGAPPLFGPGAGPRAPGQGRVDRQLVSYLRAHRGSARYLVAAEGSMTAAPILLATHENVLTLGGFGGVDPAPTVTQLKALITAGQLRFLLEPAGAPGRMGAGGRVPGSRSGASAALPFPGPPGGFARGGGATARRTWVQAHCTAVSYAASSTASTPVRGAPTEAQGLYDCSRAR